MKRSGFLIFLLGLLFLVSCGKKSTETTKSLWEKAEINFTIGEYEKAVEDYERLVKKFPKDSLAVAALFNIAEIYKIQLNEMDKAIKVYKRILRKYKKDSRAPNALFMMAYTYANEIKDLKKAEKYYKTFIKKYPDHVLRPSAEWELKYLGKDLNEIPELQFLTTDTVKTATAESK